MSNIDNLEVCSLALPSVASVPFRAVISGKDSSCVLASTFFDADGENSSSFEPSSSLAFTGVSATSLSVARVDICVSFSFTFLISSGCERDALLVDAVDLEAVDGGGPKEEEVELMGERSEEGESMQRAESSDEVELFKLLDLRAFIHGCCIHISAVIRLLCVCVCVCVCV